MQFIKKTSSTTTLIRFAIKSAFVLVLLIVAVFLLNKIDFPTPKKELLNMIKKRSTIYSKAMYNIDCNNLTKDQLVDKIINIYETNKVNS